MKRLIPVLALGFVAGAPGAAQAFHTVDTFSLPAAEGGGGIIYYTGSPRFRRWDCAACHIDAPGEISLVVRSEPPTLFEQGVYDPDAVYDITVTMEGENRGADSAANYNTFALEVLDGALTPVNGFFGFDENLLRVAPAGDVIIARGQKNIFIDEWTFRWAAPPAGTGFVDFYLAGVDGDGAGAADAEQGDPINDDVASGVLRIAERGQPAPELTFPLPTEASCRSVPLQDGLLIVALPGLGLLWRRRRAKQS